MPKGVNNLDTRFQNRGSPRRTFGSIRFDLHYAKLGIIARWDWDRYTRLAKFLDLTVHELASLICLRHRHLDLAQRDNVFPGPAALLLTLVEAQAMSAYTKDVIAEPLPKLS